MEDLASILPECPHLSFWQVHHIKGDVPHAVLIPSFTFQTHIISGSFPSSLGGRGSRGQEGQDEDTPTAFSSGLPRQRETAVHNSAPELTKDKERVPWLPSGSSFQYPQTTLPFPTP